MSDVLNVKSLFTPPGENSCSTMSTAGSVVELGSSFKVYCTFKCPCKCKGSMCSDHPPTLQGPEVFNSTTVYFNVANITMNKTYSCQCDCPQAPDSCGMDISTGCECKIFPHTFSWVAPSQHFDVSVRFQFQTQSAAECFAVHSALYFSCCEKLKMFCFLKTMNCALCCSCDYFKLKCTHSQQKRKQETKTLALNVPLEL